MNVEVVLLGLHRAVLPAGSAGDSVALSFEADAVPLSEVVRVLRMPADIGRIVLLKGEAISDEHLLQDGDVIVVVSPIAGG